MFGVSSHSSRNDAQAKMSLREHVRDDDVDAAISVLLTSFINAQKFSVRKSLERGFRKYLTRAGDLFHLLLHALRSLLREAQTYAALKAQQRGTPSSRMVLKVLIDDFEAKARELNYTGNLDECLAEPSLKLLNRSYYIDIGFTVLISSLSRAFGLMKSMFTYCGFPRANIFVVGRGQFDNGDFGC